MTNDELKDACELADLRCTEMSTNSFQVTSMDGWTYMSEEHALIPYVASLLVAKVTRGQWRTLHNAYCNQFDGFPPPYMQATDEQRIRAAVAVLKENPNG